MKNSLLLLFVLCLNLFTACDRTKTDLTVTEDTNTTEDIVASIDYDAAADLDEDLAAEDRNGPCPTRTYLNPQGTWPNTITVDYGDACVRPDGRVLKGKLIITLSDSTMRIPGATRTLTYDGFYVDDVKFEGTKSLINNGIGADGFWSITKTIDKKLIFADGTFTTWVGTKTRTLIEGAGTILNPLDNVWSITGSGAGVNRNGVDFTCNITTALKKHANCRWISEGIMTWTSGDKTRTLNFGDGTCDKFGELTRANGEVVTIKLRK
jgi:hypothetical protein